MPRPVPDRTLDCIGFFCPIPILRAREAIAEMAIGQVLEIVSDDPGSGADMESWSTRAGHTLLGVERDGVVFRFLVRRVR